MSRDTEVCLMKVLVKLEEDLNAINESLRKIEKAIKKIDNGVI